LQTSKKDVVILDPAISLAFSLSLAALLAASAAHKLMAPRAFADVVRDYQIAPSAFSPIVVTAAIAIEAAIAAGLLAASVRSIAAIGAALLFAGYGAAIGVNILRGRTAIDCGCSFGGGSRLTPLLLARNGVLTAAALIAANPVSDRALSILDYSSVGLFVLAIGVLYVAGESLIANAARFGAMESVR
jgi:hypothetical protein